MILIDHKILLLGSMNLSATSLDKNREIWIILLDPTLIAQFTTQFAKDRNRKKQ
jgi:phosphatidylserine/phosphatidylglycerophosphate/cardiolipin synthase-like enzyme